MTTNIRIGHGYDVHAFGEGDYIILGGIKILHDQGLIAHSDGDVLLHALCDAMLGALALGDIGYHFPDDDTEFEGVSSRSLLINVYGMVRQQRYRLVNADITIQAQAPKMAPHIEGMRKNIAEDLNVNISSISVKATTTEKLGFVGKKQGIAVDAVVLLAAVEY